MLKKMYLWLFCIVMLLVPQGMVYASEVEDVKLDVVTDFNGEERREIVGDGYKLVVYGDVVTEICVYSPADVIIPEGIVEINGRVSSTPKYLRSIVIPDSVVTIGVNAFMGCSGMTDVTLPAGLQCIGAGTFYGCSSLTNIILPDTVQTIQGQAFYGCTNLKTINIPSGVSSICAKTFYNCSKLKTVTIPESVTEIQDYAFYGCSSLNTITMPSNLTTIGKYAFQNCTALSAFTFPARMTKIDNYSFSGCTNLKEITVPTNITSIGTSAFANCSGLVTAVIPKEVTMIGANAFAGCGATFKIVSTLGSYAIEYAKDEDNHLAYIMTDSVEQAYVTLSASEYQYDGTQKKPSVNVVVYNKTLVNGRDYTLAYKNNVKSGTASVVITGIDAYTGTFTKTYTIRPATLTKATATLSRTSYTYNGDIKKPGVVVKWNGKSLKNGTDYKVTYKNNRNIGTATVVVTGIGNYKDSISKEFKITVNVGTKFTAKNQNYKITNVAKKEVAFTGIKNVSAKTITIPKTIKYGGVSFKVTSIADNALKNKKKLTKVTIESNVKTIGKNAFYGCKNLKTIIVKSKNIKSVGKSAFKGINTKAKIKVPAAKFNTYKRIMKAKGQGEKVTITKN